MERPRACFSHMAHIPVEVYDKEESQCTSKGILEIHSSA